MRRLICVIGFCAVALAALAVPAKRGGIMRTATDGTQRVVYLHGNEWFHYITDAEGQWLDESSLLPLSAEAKKARLASGKERVRRIQQAKESPGSRNLPPRGLMILVNFSDVRFTTPLDTIHNMINGDNFTRHYDYDYISGNGRRYQGTVDSRGSARQYFIDQSWGQYQPYFDVIGPVDLPKASTYYGQGSDSHIGEMVKAACEAADALGVDFTQYDNDNDNRVDIVYLLYAGYGAADSDNDDYIWPHNWDLSYAGITYSVDGKQVRNYACSNEIQFGSDLYNGIGTFVHEFGHAMGLPDFYCTQSNPLGTTPHTLNDWDIMDYGPYNNEGNTPPAYSAYERFFMGWLTPRVLTEPKEVSLGILNTTQEALLMCAGDAHNLNGVNPNPATFYLLENRDLTGWDTHLPGQGLLITKIKYSSGKWSGNTVNNDASNMGVDIMEAQPNTTDWGAPTDAYPAGATSFTEFADHEITHIAQDAQGVITFQYRMGQQAVEDVETEAHARKILRDGRVVIIRNGITYDLDGRQL